MSDTLSLGLCWSVLSEVFEVFGSDFAVGVFGGFALLAGVLDLFLGVIATGFGVVATGLGAGFDLRVEGFGMVGTAAFRVEAAFGVVVAFGVT